MALAAGTLPYSCKITARTADANGLPVLTFQPVNALGVSQGTAVTRPISSQDGGPITIWDIKREATIIATRQAALDAGGAPALVDAYISQSATI